MTSSCRAWLPDDTPAPAALDARLREGVHGWSQRWFTGAPMAVASLARGAREDMNWRALDDGIMLGIAPSGLLAIGARILAVDMENRPDPDRALLEELAEECLADLRKRLASLAGATEKADWRPALVPAARLSLLGDDRHPVGAVGFTAELFATLVRQSLPPLSLAPLPAADDALARISVTISAMVGRCAISVGELEALDPGDVLVLDRPHDRPVPLAINGAGLARGTATIVEAGVPTLRIAEPVA